MNGTGRKQTAVALIERLPGDAVVLPVQAIGELYTVLASKAKRSTAQARAAILSWRDAFPLTPTSSAVMLKATDLAADHQFGL